MLLYYFHTRDQLLAEVLGTVGSRLRTALEQALPPEPMAPPALLARVWSLVQAEDVEPYLRLYVEVCGLAARRHEPYRTVAMEVADEWRTWMAPRLAVPAAERASATAGLLTLLDGLLVVRFATGADAARAAEGWLLTHLD